MAAGRTRFAQRKEPVQARSRLTVQAILEATAQVLVRRGYEGATTDAVAERAGVSIGTLYQYFPNKQALVAALAQAHVQQLLDLVQAALRAHAGGTLHAALHAVIRAAIEAHRTNPALHKVLTEQVPRKRELGVALDASGRLQSLIEDLLRQHLPQLKPTRRRLMALVLESSVEALTHRAVVEAPEWLRSGELEDETMRLLGPYLAAAA